MASKKNFIGMEASPQQKDTGMTSPIYINGIEASNWYRYTGMASKKNLIGLEVSQ